MAGGKKRHPVVRAGTGPRKVVPVRRVHPGAGSAPSRTRSCPVSSDPRRTADPATQGKRILGLLLPLFRLFSRPPGDSCGSSAVAASAATARSIRPTSSQNLPTSSRPRSPTPHASATVTNVSTTWSSVSAPQLPQLLLLPVPHGTFAGEKKHPSHGGNPYSESLVTGILGGPPGGGGRRIRRWAKAVMTARRCFDRGEEVGIPSPVIGALPGPRQRCAGLMTPTCS